MCCSLVSPCMVRARAARARRKTRIRGDPPVRVRASGRRGADVVPHSRRAVGERYALDGRERGGGDIRRDIHGRDEMANLAQCGVLRCRCVGVEHDEDEGSASEAGVVCGERKLWAARGFCYHASEEFDQ